jgi:hypothetical protein
MKLTPRKRRAIATAALVAAVLSTFVAASIVSREFFEGPTRTAAPHHPQLVNAVTAPMQFRVAAIQGGVEVLHNGQWYVVQAGDLLPLQDLIRTNKDGKAILRRGGAEVEVRPDVDIRLEKIAKDTSSLRLIRGGSVITTVEDPSAHVEITTAETRSENEGESRWVVELGIGGEVVIGTAKGKVKFAAQGKEVSVTAGHESTARPGQAPSEPEPIPEELLLSVIWPEIDHAQPAAQVAGKVRPSSRVKVNGVDAQIHPDGRFASTVPLGVGANKIEVQAEDILGRKKAVNKMVKRAPPSPTLEPTDEDLWKR